MLAAISPDRYISILSVLFYAFAAFLSVPFWKNGLKGKIFPWILIPIIALLLHTVAITLRGISTNVCPMHTLFDAGILIAWILSATALITIRFSQTRYIGFSLYPLLFLLGASVHTVDWFTRNSSRLHDTISPWINLHITFALLAYVSMAIATIVSLAYLTQQKLLKGKNSTVIHSLLPSIQKLESVSAIMLLHGLIFLAISLCIGFVSLHYQEDSWVLSDPKILWSGLLWLFIVTTYTLYRINKLRGRKLSTTIIVIFLYILMTAWVASSNSHIHNEKLSVEKQPLNQREIP